MATLYIYIVKYIVKVIFAAHNFWRENAKRLDENESFFKHIYICLKKDSFYIYKCVKPLFMHAIDWIILSKAANRLHVYIN